MENDKQAHKNLP